jgi:hypothetical protein
MFEFKLWNSVYNFIEFIQFPMNFGWFGSIWIIHIKSKVKWKKLMCTWAGFYLAQLLGPAQPGLAAHGSAWVGRPDSRRGAAWDGGAATSRA